MDKELIQAMIDYVEETEENYDGEFGSCRKFHEILKDDAEVLPEFYFKLKEMLNE